MTLWCNTESNPWLYGIPERVHTSKRKLELWTDEKLETDGQWLLTQPVWNGNSQMKLSEESQRTELSLHREFDEIAYLIADVRLRKQLRGQLDF